MRYSKHGFTLIELIIVIVIIGILASIAAPMMQGMSEKAMKSEAITYMGAIRNAERLYYTKYGDYTVANLEPEGFNPLAEFISTSDVAGQYFTGDCFKISLSSPPPRYHIQCYPSYSTAPGKDKVKTMTTFAMEMDGSIINWP